VGGGAVAVGSCEGVRVVSWDGSLQANARGFAVTCLAALGSQSLAAGCESGRVCVWHWRRETLKQVYDVPSHPVAVSALANGGDVLVVGSTGGKVKQLVVLDNFVLNDFDFEAGAAVRCLALYGRRTLLVGCENGQVLEVNRNTSEVLQSFELGSTDPAAVVALDVDERGHGCLLAASDGCVAVWVPHSPAHATRPSKMLPTPPLANFWPMDIGGVTGALLLPGGCPGAFLAAGPGGLALGGPGVANLAVEGPDASLPVAALVRDSAGTSVLVLTGVPPGSAGSPPKDGKPKPVLLELELRNPPGEPREGTPRAWTVAVRGKDEEGEKVEDAQVGAAHGANVGARAKVDVRGGEGEEAAGGVGRGGGTGCTVGSSRGSGCSTQPRSENQRRRMRYLDPTEASLARSSQ